MYHSHNNQSLFSNFLRQQREHSNMSTALKSVKKVVYVSTVLSKYFPNQDRYRRNQDIVRKLVEQQIFLKFQVLVKLIWTGAIDDQNFELLLNNFARLTNITSKECSASVQNPSDGMLNRCRWPNAAGNFFLYVINDHFSFNLVDICLITLHRY